ncbi:hypothetical protein NQZ68_015186 [Dissostichus eleginoides]|nr:hypothetical protein NQZ68_015186 [Dissostichus eleginoides]
MPSSSGVKCKSKQKHTSQEHGAVSKRARDEGQGGVGTRWRSATPSLTGRSNPVATGRYTPGLLEAMEDTAVNAIGAKVATSDERQGDREDLEDREDRAMADLDEPEMAMEVTELLMWSGSPAYICASTLHQQEMAHLLPYPCIAQEHRSSAR